MLYNNNTIYNNIIIVTKVNQKCASGQKQSEALNFEREKNPSEMQIHMQAFFSHGKWLFGIISM